MALRISLRRLALQNQAKGPLVMGVRTIVGKSWLSEDTLQPKTKPFDYKKKDYFGFMQVWDKTTRRFDENTKLIVVEGAHAVGKSAFAKELADELGMHYMPPTRLSDHYIDSYGTDFHDYSEYFIPEIRPYDEKNFAMNPVGPVDGCGDKFLYNLYKMKFLAYLNALRHIFSTGQGIVMEGSPYSDPILYDAAYNQGWVERTSRTVMKQIYRRSHAHLLRPNLWIYLDAPVDVAMKKIQERGNEWDKDSPVYTNKHYLNEIYSQMKRVFLKEQQRHSQVLVYDWSEPGDIEIVVEDIEALNFDFYELYEEQQMDWRLFTEERYASARMKYCNDSERTMAFCSTEIENLGLAPAMMYSPDVHENMDDVMYWVKSQRYAPSWNTQCGDPQTLFRLTKGWNPLIDDHEELERAMHMYRSYGTPRSKWFGDTRDVEGM